ncbi:MAG: hypothetical protein WAO28_04410 [Candidatus Microsaccharimonas sp.]
MNVLLQPALHIPSSRAAMRTEAEFDDAIAGHNIPRARWVIARSMDTFGEKAQRGTYTSGLGRVAIKELTVPFYNRAILDAEGSDYGNREPALSSVYHDTVRLIAYLREWQNGAILAGLKDDDPLLEDLRGDLSELLILALTARDINGNPKDRYNILPTTTQQDRQGENFDNSELLQRFDFIVKKRRNGKTIPVQVKTTQHTTTKHYHPRIVVISTVKLAGGNRILLSQLQNALINEVSGEATSEEVDRIETATKTLRKIYKNHMRLYGQKAVTAVNL